MNDGLKSFWLDKFSGAECFMLSSKNLSIAWGSTPEYWGWPSVPESRFKEVAELRDVCWLEIRGQINTCMLSPSTLYAAYLVFKLTAHAHGLKNKPAEVSVGIAGNDNDAHKRFIYLDPRKAESENRNRRQAKKIKKFDNIQIREQMDGSRLNWETSSTNEKMTGSWKSLFVSSVHVGRVALSLRD